MGVIATDKNLIKLYYNSKSLNDREALTYLTSSNADMLAIDTAVERLSELQWETILDGLNKKPEQLIDDNELNKLDAKPADTDFSANDWLKILKHNPEIIRGVILSKGDEYQLFESPKSVIEYLADAADSSNTNRE